jgi:CubicO group peptidase (beta-lactamase class C family)
MLDWPAMTAALAGQEPWWPPGTGHGYHVNTFGFLAGEVIRRATGTTVGTLLRDEIAGPLGADVHIGLPVSEHERVATFIWPGPPPAEEEPPGLDPALLMEHNAYYNPGGLSGAGVINSPRPSRFGLGFQLTQPERPIGPGRAAFGHFGAGGSLGFADPETGVAFGYVMNQMGPRWQNPRTRALVDAVYESLAR